MANRFSSGRKSLAVCDICGFQFKLPDLRPLIIKGKNVNILACGECWSEDHPQLMLGSFPIEDPQAVMNPRKDTTYIESGNHMGGSRDIQWGWAPVGGSRDIDAGLTPNELLVNVTLGTVTVTVS